MRSSRVTWCIPSAAEGSPNPLRPARSLSFVAASRVTACVAFEDGHVRAPEEVRVGGVPRGSPRGRKGREEEGDRVSGSREDGGSSLGLGEWNVAPVVFVRGRWCACKNCKQA